MERPILFNGDMVRAILDGRKTQTRRLLKGPGRLGYVSDIIEEVERINGKEVSCGFADDYGKWHKTEEVCPFGQPGDELWVRETFSRVPATAYVCSREEDGSMVPHRVSPDGYEWAVYKVGWTRSAPPWKPSIHMPRWASRISLEITNIRAEHLQDIDDTDAEREGCDGADFKPGYSTNEFRKLWESINGQGSWAANPWVWVVEFARIS
jgi:hypothetical protein